MEDIINYGDRIFPIREDLGNIVNLSNIIFPTVEDLEDIRKFIASFVKLDRAINCLHKWKNVKKFLLGY